MLCVVSCSGYGIKRRANPFAHNGIESVSIPIFINETNLPDVSGLFSKEFISLMSSFDGLKVVSGKSFSTDAILLGFIRTPKYRRETFTRAGQRLSTDVAPTSVGTRRKFFVTSNNRVRIELQMILIKNPTETDLIFLKSKLKEYSVKHSKVIFDQTFDISGNFALEIQDREGTEVNFTQNKGNLKRFLSTLATTGAKNFKELVLYDF